MNQKIAAKLFLPASSWRTCASHLELRTLMMMAVMMTKMIEIILKFKRLKQDSPIKLIWALPSV